MIEAGQRERLLAQLGSFGSDFSRWPRERISGAREALLSDPEFRRAWERERELDRALEADQLDLDRVIKGSGALDRVRRRTLARLPGPLAGLGWQRIAAAMVIAGLLGGALDLFLMQQPAEMADLVMLDPLYGLNDTELQ